MTDNKLTCEDIVTNISHYDKIKYKEKYQTLYCNGRYFKILQNVNYFKDTDWLVRVS